ncbi:MAG: SDR family oxidoreductase [Deltaproteobacteria bacterium]|nr:SDR family oxidoreductase [Deltaproteobacteria bacterium]
MRDLRDRVVLVTGGAGGIGLCTAEEFAKAGATVVLTDIDAGALATAAERLGRHGRPVYTRMVDVTDRAQVDEAAKWVLATFGGLDILINNAGIGHHGEMAETSLETWKKLVDVNLWGPLYHVYAFLPSMLERGRGHIVNVSSGQAFFRLPTWGAYAAIKAATGAFSEVLGFEVRRRGVRVTTVYPFMTNTPFYRGVEGETWAAKLSMKLLPYYSMTPERVGRIIFEAVWNDRRVELVSPLNLVGFYTHLVPPLFTAVSEVAAFFMAKGPRRAAGGKKE